MANSLKKIFFLTVALIVVLPVIPAVHAETTAEKISVGTTAELDAVIDRLAEETGLNLEIKLTADIAMTKQIELIADSAHTLTIDLNSKKLTAKDDAAIRALAMFDGSVTIKNGTIEMPGINETTTNGTTGAGMGGLIFVMGDCLVLEKTIVTKTASKNMAGDGGIICLRSTAASLEMIASTVQAAADGDPDASVGGTVRVTNGAKLYMREGSVIRDGYASDYGGNIAVAGTSYAYIYDNSLITGGICDGTGGNIYLGNANIRFFVYHGTICDGTAAKGGNIGVGNGRFFYEGEISGGAADEGEGASVYLQSNTNVYFYLGGGMGVVNVYGGTFIGQNPDQASISATETVSYVAEDCHVIDNGDGTYTVAAKVYAAITTQPGEAEVNVGETAQFTVEAVGDDLTYNWEYSRNGSAWYNTTMEGNDTATLSVAAILSRNGYRYRCVVTDIYGNEVVSEAATLTVIQPAGLAKIVSQSEAKEATAGQIAVFTVVAEGEGLVPVAVPQKCNRQLVCDRYGRLQYRQPECDGDYGP